MPGRLSAAAPFLTPRPPRDILYSAPNPKTERPAPMAKTTAPLLSLDAHGTIGDTLTYSRAAAVNSARAKPTPTGSPSADQLAHRQLVANCALAWRHLDAYNQEAWSRRATACLLARTSYNVFWQSALLEQQSGAPPISAQACPLATFNIGFRPACQPFLIPELTPSADRAFLDLRYLPAPPRTYAVSSAHYDPALTAYSVLIPWTRPPAETRFSWYDTDPYYPLSGTFATATPDTAAIEATRENLFLLLRSFDYRPPLASVPLFYDQTAAAALTGSAYADYLGFHSAPPNSCLQYPAVTTFGHQSYTASIWSQIDDYAPLRAGGIAWGDSVGVLTQFAFRLTAGTGAMRATVSNGTSYRNVTYAIPNTNWHQWTMVVTPDRVTLYLDGHNPFHHVLTMQTSYPPGSYFCALGRPNGLLPLNGVMDDIRLYSAALSEAQVHSLYELTKDYYL